MLRPITRATLLLALLTSTACTQQPAHVELRGQNTYARNGTLTGPAAIASYKTATSSAPISQETYQAASSESVGVSDLSAPVKPAAAMAKAQPIYSTRMAVASDANAQKVNPWTGRPHFAAAPAEQAFRIEPKGKQQPKPQLVSDVTKPAAHHAPKQQIAKAATSAFMWPVSSHKVISSFGPKGGGKVNDGINIASADGEPVWAAADGEIVYAGNGLKGYGNMVLIKHANGKTTAYAHMSRFTVDKYDHVKQGDIIGYVGTTGGVKSPQLHFAIRDGKDPVDPTKYLSRSVAGL